MCIGGLKVSIQREGMLGGMNIKYRRAVPWCRRETLNFRLHSAVGFLTLLYVALSVGVGAFDDPETVGRGRRLRRPGNVEFLITFGGFFYIPFRQ